MKRLSRWITRRIGMRNLLSLSLLLIVLTSASTKLAETVRGFEIQLALTVAVIGLVAGWSLSTTSLSDWRGGIVASALGCGGILLCVGHLDGKLTALLGSSAGVVWSALRWTAVANTGLSSRWIRLMAASAELWVGAGTLLTRVRSWISAQVAGEPFFDPVAAALTWSLTVWGVSVWAGWMVQRRDRPLAGVAPAGVLLVARLSYTGGDPHTLLIPLGATLLLLALVGYDVRVRHWRATGVDFAEVGGGVAAVAIALSLLLVAMAAVAPSVSAEDIIDVFRRPAEVQTGGGGASDGSAGAWRNLGRERTTIFDGVRAAGLPRRHLIGSGPELSERVVMVISTGDLPPMDEYELDMMHVDVPRYYWRSITYDRYARRGWFTRDTETVRYEAGESAITPTLETRRRMRQTVRVVGETGGLVHAAGELITVDKDYSVAWRPHDDMFGAMIEATTYRVDSLAPAVSVGELRSAGSDYPAWLEERYLTLPDTVPDRVLALARDLTATEPTPYDRARAIEMYLREFPYTLDVPSPPSNRDLVSYFLFDLQKGYCDYYATAMVVLARAAGLPARLSVGYASGSYDPYQARYVVTEADAHAWPEIYFPGHGWIPFEPTGGLPSIERPTETTPPEWPEPEGELEPESKGPRWTVESWSWWLVGAGGLALSVTIGIVYMTADALWLRHLEPGAAVAVLYRRLRRRARSLAVPTRVGDTPYEFASSLVGRMTDLARGVPGVGEVLSAAVEETSQLIELYVRASYSSRSPSAADRSSMIGNWQRLRWRLWLVWLWQRLSGGETRPGQKAD